MRLDILGNLVACSAATLAVLTRGHSLLTPGMVGLSLTNAFSVNNLNLHNVLVLFVYSMWI